MNERGHENGNSSITEGRELPWLQDLDADDDGLSDNWLSDDWDYKYRDVVIVDADNMVVEAYNLTTNDLEDPDNYSELTEKLLSAARTTKLNVWTNSVDVLDVNDDASISPLDALFVLNVLNSIGPHELGEKTADDYYLDTNEDGFVSPLDALLVINRLNEMNSVTVAAVAAPATAPVEDTQFAGIANANGAPRQLPGSLIAAAIDESFSDEHRTG